ncbi:hypothetical protein AB0M12_20790 [Nocardia vinacea]|uniref:hypothetical protein n=1 Tax=Nocardia vinacea TaxID=96468 RepID=UPI00342C03C4
MGFASAAGVLLDAFIVRMILIPLLLVLLGKWAGHDRADIDVEGIQVAPNCAGSRRPARCDSRYGAAELRIRNAPTGIRR